MSRLIKIVIPDAGPINTLAAAGLLDLLLAPPNTQVVVVKSVLNEIVHRRPELSYFIKMNAARIQIVETSICKDDATKAVQGIPAGRGRGDLAIADFIMNYIDDVLGNGPALVIFEDIKFGRLRNLDAYSQNAHFITTAAFLRKLKAEGKIESFEEVWEQIVAKNSSPDPKLHRAPNPIEIEQEAEAAQFSSRNDTVCEVHFGQ